MAERPVFVPGAKAPFVDVFRTEFVWNGGMAVTQKQKNIDALHAAFRRKFPESQVLEISSKSRQELGVQLSAFNLKKYVSELGRSISVECAFQGSKVFAAGGPYTDLYAATSREAKKDPRLRSGGMLRGFFFDGKEIPPTPRTAFYNWLYINALLENPELAEQVSRWDGFTDIEFNPERGLNCQAEAAAVFVSLYRQGMLKQAKDFESFVETIRPQRKKLA